MPECQKTQAQRPWIIAAIAASRKPADVVLRFGAIAAFRQPLPPAFQNRPGIP